MVFLDGEDQTPTSKSKGRKEPPPQSCCSLVLCFSPASPYCRISIVFLVNLARWTGAARRQGGSYFTHCRGGGGGGGEGEGEKEGEGEEEEEEEEEEEGWGGGQHATQTRYPVRILAQHRSSTCDLRPAT